MTKEHQKVEKHKKDIDMQDNHLSDIKKNIDYLFTKYNISDIKSDPNAIIAARVAEILCSGWVAGGRQRSKEFQD